jgi:hypothetical protein
MLPKGSGCQKKLLLYILETSLTGVIVFTQLANFQQVASQVQHLTFLCTADNLLAAISARLAAGGKSRRKEPEQ